MSSIGSDPHLNLTGLGGLGGQVAFDDLQGRQPQGTPQAEALRDTGAAPPAAAGIDAGEAMLVADAWGGTPEGERLLSGEPAFEGALGALDLSAAADGAVEAILSGLGTA